MPTAVDPAVLASVQALRADLWRRGYRPVPIFNPDSRVGNPGKQPLGNGWQEDARRNPPFCIAATVRHALGTGILCDGLRPFDIDVDDPELATLCAHSILARLGLPTPTRGRGNSPRRILVYRAAEGSPHHTSVTGRTHTKAHACKIEVLGAGEQFVAYGVHPSGTPYRWSPELGTYVDLVAVTEAQVIHALAECAAIIGADPPAVLASRGNGVDQPTGYKLASASRLWCALAAIPNDGPPDWHAWNRIGLAVWAATGGSAAGLAAWDEWSAANAAYDADYTAARWFHISKSPPRSIGAGSIFREAAQYGWIDPARPPPPSGVDAYGTVKSRRADQKVAARATARKILADRIALMIDRGDDKATIEGQAYTLGHLSGLSRSEVEDVARSLAEDA